MNPKDDGIRGNGDVTITIQGTGTLSVAAAYGIFLTGNSSVTISDGTVNIDAGYNGIGVKDVTISGGTVNITAGDTSDGIEAVDVTISGGAVEIDAGNGINAYDTVTISGGAVEIDAGDDGIYAYSGNITISGGTVEIDEDGGIDAYGNVTISGGTVNITTGDESFGIEAHGNVTISGGAVEIDAVVGIQTYGNATISGGTVTIAAEDYGIFATGVVRFTGGSLDITGDSFLVGAKQGIEIDDSLLPNGVTIEQNEDRDYILVSESGTSIRIDSGAATTNYFGKVIRSMQTISFPGVPELDGLWRAFGSTINLTKITPEPRDGYTFTGWYADEACTKPITKIVVTGNMQLFAGWEEIAEEEETGTAEAEQ